MARAYKVISWSGGRIVKSIRRVGCSPFFCRLLPPSSCFLLILVPSLYTAQLYTVIFKLISFGWSKEPFSSSAQKLLSATNLNWEVISLGSQRGLVTVSRLPLLKPTKDLPIVLLVFCRCLSHNSSDDCSANGPKTDNTWAGSLIDMYRSLFWQRQRHVIRVTGLWNVEFCLITLTKLSGPPYVRVEFLSRDPGWDLHPPCPRQIGAPLCNIKTVKSVITVTQESSLTHKIFHWMVSPALSLQRLLFLSLDNVVLASYDFRC